MGYSEVDHIVLQRMSALQRQEGMELWIKPVPELKYLNADNVARYRLIMRYFYENHRKLRYWLKPDEVFAGINAWGLLPDYSLEMCQRDLDILVDWRNLNARHDGGRATTIEEYLRKRFRYQMTPYSIEIERMLESLENLQGYGGSLEPTLLERIAGYVVRIRESGAILSPADALQLWRDLQNSFRQLHENASDYLASLQSVKAEELMQTEQFLVFKDTLTNYLRNFVMGLQRYGSKLEGLLYSTASHVWEQFIDLVCDGEDLTPTLDDAVDPARRKAQRLDEWDSFARWFIGSASDASDLVYLERQTKDSITRVLRSALAIQEKHRFGVSRKRELDHLGKWFFRIDDIEEAHRLGAYAFGLFRARHFQGEPRRSTDSPHVSMWEEPPTFRILRSRSRVRTKSADVEFIREHKEKKRLARLAVMEQKAREDAMLLRFVEKGAFSMSELDDLQVHDRALLLAWISRCLVNRKRTIRTPDGLEIRLTLPSVARRALIRFPDGVLDLPDFHITIRPVNAS